MLRAIFKNYREPVCFFGRSKLS